MNYKERLQRLEQQKAELDHFKSALILWDSIRFALVAIWIFLLPVYVLTNHPIFLISWGAVAIGAVMSGYKRNKVQERFDKFAQNLNKKGE